MKDENLEMFIAPFATGSKIDNGAESFKGLSQDGDRPIFLKISAPSPFMTTYRLILL
jgi:hypothetical protein